ncbi:ATP-binding protein [Streptomyces boninensis]|uniref:ATP-binding protein n=1 Tax=Streptomyces boninensis TaxID=2039455 RepID=UPI003B2281FC
MGDAELRGRQDEVRRIERMLAAAREGKSGALLVHGEAGIGKTALLDHAAEQAVAEGVRVLRTEGVESETDLAFGGLHQLFLPVLDTLDRLPTPQATALRAILGLTDAPVHDRFTVALAALSVLSEAATDQPVLCVIDDVQWLDQPSTDALAFAARRLYAEGVVMLFGLRDTTAVPRLKGIPRLPLTGLDREATGDLLTGLLPSVADRIAEQAQGNPLALRVLSAALTPAQRAGQLGSLLLPADVDLPDLLAERIGRLPGPTRGMLAVAAADDTGDLAVVVAAAARLGGTVADLEPAEQAGLIRLSADTLRFGHPLMRYAAYRSAALARRQAVHRALAATLDPDRHAHRRAWHLAAAATGPDEGVAGELERVAEWAGNRQAMASASAAYERAAQLTADPSLRAWRLIDAAQRAGEAGQDQRCRMLADQVPLPLKDPAMAADFARARAVVELGYGSPAQAARILLDCAEEVGATRPDRLRPLLTDAIHAALSAGDPELLSEVATRAPALPVLTVPARLFGPPTGNGRAPAGTGPALTTGDPAPTTDGLMDHLMSGHYALLLADPHRAHEHATTAVARCRAQGIQGWLPTTLGLLARAETALGRTDDAHAHATEALRLADYYDLAHRAAHLRACLALLAAAQGREAETRKLAAQALAYARPRDVGRATADALHALGLLELGLGHAESALEQLQAADRAVGSHPALAQDFLPRLIEAAVRAGHPAAAQEPTARLATWASSWTSAANPAPTPPGLTALSRRCIALTAPDADAGAHYTAALTLHTAAGTNADPTERAHTALLYGEWLRRKRRPLDAREHLRTAMDLFAAAGAIPWADRARTELEAAGESHDPVTGTRFARLSPQEREVVRLAATGATNREIATQLFLSPRTIGHHLYRAFPKLGISSRTELANLLD